MWKYVSYYDVSYKKTYYDVLGGSMCILSLEYIIITSLCTPLNFGHRHSYKSRCLPWFAEVKRT